jgi:hypothetical protein
VQPSPPGPLSGTGTPSGASRHLPRETGEEWADTQVRPYAGQAWVRGSAGPGIQPLAQ